MQQDAPPRLSVRNLTKRFGALVANDSVSLDIAPGELHCLLGENGAGKSTLSSCLYGLYRPESGEIRVDGRPVRLSSPADAIAAGIGMVHQHFVLVPGFTVLENIAVGRGTGWRLDHAGVRARIREICDAYAIDLDPTRPVGDLSVGEQQWVEIAKVLYTGARILILDEPTAVLTPEESQKLFAVIDRLRADGISVLLISHKMAEVMRSDRVSVLRKGRLVGTVATAATDRGALTEMMVGRHVAATARPKRDNAARSADVLTVEGLSLARGTHRRLEGISFGIAAGEIVGLAGVSGNGQDELFECLWGLRTPDRGRIVLGGDALEGRGVARAAAAGVGYVPSDRFRDGLVGDLSVAENLVLGQQWQARWRRGPFLRRRAIAVNARDAIAAHAIATSGPDLACRKLSGGNAQKVILAREFEKARRLLLCNQPTRGLDVGAIEFVHREILRKRDEGCAVLLASEELDDLFALADRIGVIFRGRLMAVFDAGTATHARIGRLMAGHEEHEDTAA